MTRKAMTQVSASMFIVAFIIVGSLVSECSAGKPLIDPTQQISTVVSYTNSKLFDLSSDPYETRNVADEDEYADAMADLSNRATLWQSNARVPWVPDTTNQKTVWSQSNGVVPWISSPTPDIAYESKYNYEKAPHIVFVMVDDWGWNDFGRRSTYLSWTTPTIDKLSYEGINLENYQTYQTCSPARGAFLTGKYPIRLGLWELHDQAELSTAETSIAEELKTANYRTYLVGKWHAGSSTVGHTPNYRGFDYFYGYFSSYIDYWTKTYEGYLDLHENTKLVTNTKELDSELHSAHLFQSKVESVIATHSSMYSDQPMFLYYAMQLVHSPWTAPDNYLSRCQVPSVTNTEHVDPSSVNLDALYNMCGMNLMLDEAIANLTCTLKDHDMSDNTVLIIASDNGGEGTILGNSYPYKGHKGSFYRGGLSTTAIVHSELIPKSSRGVTYTGLVHVTDWFPTIMGLATNGEWQTNDQTLDGIDMWETITTNADSPREEIIHMLDGEKAVIQFKTLKMLSGQADNVVDYPSFEFTRDLDSKASSMSCGSPWLVSSVSDPVQPPQPQPQPQPPSNVGMSNQSYDKIAFKIERIITLFTVVFVVGLIVTAISSIRHHKTIDNQDNSISKENVREKNFKFGYGYGSTHGDSGDEYHEGVPLVSSHASDWA